MRQIGSLKRVQFILSRNFRNQNVGKLSWILKNYDLEEVTNFIDELIKIYYFYE